MNDEAIDIVDEQDTVIGTTTKHEAQTKGLRHRIVRITLEDGAGNVLLQKRNDDKELYPGCWDSAAAGHVGAGEDYLQAAERELEQFVSEDAATGRYDEPLTILFHQRNQRLHMALGAPGTSMVRHYQCQRFDGAPSHVVQY